MPREIVVSFCPRCEMPWTKEVEKHKTDTLCPECSEKMIRVGTVVENQGFWYRIHDELTD